MKASIDFLSPVQFEEGADSNAKCNDGLDIDILLEAIFEEHLSRSSEPKALARAGIETPSNVIELALVMHAQVRSLGQVLPDQAIGVLVDSALPGAVRVRKVDFQSCALGQLFVQRHLLALVVGQGLA